MKLLFTASNTILGKAIRWIFNEPCSHFAIQFDKIVFHSNLIGVHIEWADKFKESSKVIYEKDIYLCLEDEEKIYLSINKIYDGKLYDFPAMFFMGIHGLMHKWFKKPMPTINRWGTKKAFLCTALAGIIPTRMYPGIKKVNDLEMITPYKLYKAIQGD